MTGLKDKRSALALIERNIRESGYHVYTVSGGPDPRFAYTIGLTESPLGAELVLPGAISFLGDDVYRILDVVRRRLTMTAKFDSKIAVDEQGTFTFRKVHPSWTKELLLGALDYYKGKDVVAYQVVPDRAHFTIDVPDLAVEWDTKKEPAWHARLVPLGLLLAADPSLLPVVDLEIGAGLWRDGAGLAWHPWAKRT